MKSFYYITLKSKTILNRVFKDLIGIEEWVKGETIIDIESAIN